MSEDSIQNTPVKGSKNNFKGKIHVIVIILIILAVSFISALLIEKHTNKSIYSKLSVANYNQNNLNVSFNYPSVMSYNNALVEKLSKDNTPLVYNYAINSHQKKQPDMTCIGMYN